MIFSGCGQKFRIRPDPDPQQYVEVPEVAERIKSGLERLVRLAKRMYFKEKQNKFLAFQLVTNDAPWNVVIAI
jgi:hypothetical protein